MTRRVRNNRPLRPPSWKKLLGATLLLAVVLSASVTGGVAATSKPTATLVVGIPDDPPNLDVQLAANPLTSPLVINVYEALTKLDKNEGVVPSLAKSWKQINPTMWRFNLRPGVTFTNGEAFNPAAAIFSFTRALVPASENLSYFGAIVSATQAGPNAIDVHTSSPDPNVPRELAFLYMVPPAYVQNSLSQYTTQQAIGTGPYTFGSWTPGQSYTFTANPKYWGNKPVYKSVTFKVIPDANVRLQALRASEIQLTRGISTDAVSQAPRVRADIVNEVCMIRLNTLKGPFSDPRLRQAANYAIDRASLIKALYGRYAQVPHAQLVTPASFGYSTAIKDYPYDVAKAKSLLSAASYTNAPIQLIGRAGRWPNDRNLELATTNMLQQAGLNVQITIADTATWRAAVFNDPRPDAVFFCTSDDNLTGIKVLQSLAVPTGSQATYNNPAVTTAVASAATEFNDAKRAQQLQAIWTQLKADAAFLPLLSIDAIWAMSKDVVWKPRHDGLLVVDDIRLVTPKVAKK